MKALTLRPPWGHAVVHLGKDIENRTWRTEFRGRILIHQGKGCTASEYGDAAAFIFDACGAELPTLEQLDRGFIVGAATIVDCVEESSSPWFVGPYGFVLADVKPAPRLVACRGMQGFFDVPADVAAELRRAA